MGCCRDFAKAIIFLLLAGCVIYHSHHYTAKSLPEYSHLVRFEVSIGEEGVSQPFCTGSLVSPRHVLTAAHCFNFDFNYDGMKIEAVLGSDQIDAKMEVRAIVKAVHVHPDYSRLLWHRGNDIAVVELLPSIESLEPIYLAADFNLSRVGEGGEDGIGLMVSYAGWGNRRVGSEDIDSPSKKGGQLELVIDDKGECGLLAMGEMCSKYEGDLSNSPFYGDSGSPVMKKEGQKSWQMGVLVRGIDGKSITITSVSPHCPWVEKTTGGEVQCEKMASPK